MREAIDGIAGEETGTEELLFDDLPPLPEDRFAALLRDLTGHVTPDDLPFLQALIDQTEKN